MFDWKLLNFRRCAAIAIALAAANLAFGQSPSTATTQSAAPAVSLSPESPEQLRDVESAMKRLDPLLGDWQASGFVRGPAGPNRQMSSHWHVERAFGGRYLRLEFVMRNESRRIAFVGYFTYDPADKTYRTLWVSPDTLYQFSERGSLDETGTKLTLVSHQQNAGGKEAVVTSIFRFDRPDKFTVEDRTETENAEPFVSFHFDAVREKPRQ